MFLEDVLNRAVEQTRQIIHGEERYIQRISMKRHRKSAVGAVVFNELSNYRIKDYVFSWDKVLNFEGETGPYVQYTHARACSILQQMPEKIPLQRLQRRDFDTILDHGEKAHTMLIKLLYAAA